MLYGHHRRIPIGRCEQTLWFMRYRFDEGRSTMRCQATLHIRNYALSLKAMMLKRSVAVAFAGALYISRMRVKIDDDFVVHFASRSALYNLACCRYNAT